MKDSLFEQIKHFTPNNKKSRHTGLKNPAPISEDIFITAKEAPRTLNHNLTRWNLIFLLTLSIGFSLFFISRAFTLQIIQSDSGKALADQNRVRNLLLQPERGVIYDRNGNYVVRNKPAFSINLTTNVCYSGGKDYCRSLAGNIAGLVVVDLERVNKEIDAVKPEVILATGLTKEQILPVEANLSKYPGVSIVTNPMRDYLYKDAFSHVVGYVGIGGESTPTIVGKYGVEKSYNEYISGTFGNRLVQVDASGNYLSTISEKSPVPGQNITLFLDLELQNKAYELIKKTVDDKLADAAVVVAQDPRNGGILAMVSYPSFDPNKLSGGITNEELNQLNNDPGFPFFNRAISASYPPGSTFKMVTASAALSEKVVTEHTIINDPGYISVSGFTFRNWKLDGHGEVNMNRALQVSNDTYFYTVGGGYGGIQGLGIDRLSKWAKRFGFGSKTGVDLEGESEGYMPDGTARQWYLGDTYITSIGQGDVLATPLQVNNYVTYFANKGAIYKPRAVKSIDGVPNKEPETLVKNLIDEKNLNIVREGMKKVVEPGGTAYPLFDFPQRHPGIELAGKTGTSEYTDRFGKERTHALFTVFGPYEDANIVLTVFLEGGGGGSDTAAPIAKELLDLWFK